jgi:Transposase IS66 family
MASSPVPDPLAAAFFYSRDRGGEHPERHLASYAGLMQADAYAGFSRLYEAGRKVGRSSRRPAGRTHAASSSTWRGFKSRRLRPRPSNGSMRCSLSSARSTVSYLRSASLFALSAADL